MYIKNETISVELRARCLWKDGNDAHTTKHGIEFQTQNSKWGIYEENSPWLNTS